MNLIPIQFSDLEIAQPILWDLFNQEKKLILKQGYTIKTTDELEELSKSLIFRRSDNLAKEQQSEVKNTSEFKFDDMQLRVGDKLHLRLHSSAKSQCCSKNGGYCMVTIIGYLPGYSLIVTMPRTDQFIGQPLLEGDQILARLCSGRYIFSFTTLVDKLIKQPLNYLHLSFPKHISGKTVRKSRRIKTTIDAHAVIGDDSLPLIITNLSSTGAEISTHAELGEVGAQVELFLRIKIHDKETSLQLMSTIRSYKDTNREGALRYGVEFTGLQTEQIFLLRSFIYQELIDNPSSVI